jgi:fido (protein-threonine AMPylation protein)
LGIEVLERGQPGQFRDFDHFSRSGYHFSMPENVLSDLNMFCQTDYDDAFTKHVAYESIHPFCDGNGRSGRIILLKDLDYDFYSCNDLINNDYIARIIKIQNN